MYRNYVIKKYARAFCSKKKRHSVFFYLYIKVSNKASHQLRRLISKSKKNFLIHILKFPIFLFQKGTTLLEKNERKQIAFFEKNTGLLEKMGLSIKKHDGILLMIGSLGAGGAENQAVLTLLGLNQYQYSPLSCCAFLLETVEQRFRLPALLNNKIKCTALDFSWEKEPRYSHIKALESILPAKLYDVLACVATLLKEKPKVLHLWLDEVNINAGIAAIIVGIPRIILNTRNVPPDTFAWYRPYMLEWYRWLTEKKQVVMTNNSYAGAQAYEKWLNLPEGYVKVIYNGFDFNHQKIAEAKKSIQSTRESWGIALNIPLIGTVIRLNEEKQPLLWLEVAAKILKEIPQAHFLIVGDGLMRKAVKKRITQLGLVSHVHLVGLYKEPLKAMAAMDAFLLTSRMEGLPNVLIESQAVGTPVITTNAGGASEALFHKETGWVLEKDDSDYIAKKVIELLSSPDWLRQAKEKGPEFVQNNFSMARMINETINIYD